MASAPSSSSLLSRISKLFSRSEEAPSINADHAAPEAPAQRLAWLIGDASSPLTGKGAEAEEEANDAALEEAERDAAEAARSEEPSYNDWLEHKAGEHFLSDDQEQAAMDTFFENDQRQGATTLPSSSPALPRTPEEFAKFIDDHAEPAALAAFQKQFRAIGVADITVLSGQTVSATKHRGDVSYNIRPATMDELRPEIAKAAANGRLPTSDATVAKQGGTVTLDEGRQPNTTRPLDLSLKSEMMKDATADLLRRRESEGRADPALSKNHKAIVEDFLTHKATPAQVADFQQQLASTGAATLTLVTAQTITAARTNGPKDLPSTRYDIRPATKDEYQPHLAAIQTKVNEEIEARKAATPQVFTDSVGRQNNTPGGISGKDTYLRVTSAQGREVAKFAGKLAELESTLRTEGEAFIQLAPGIRIIGSTDTSSFGETFADGLTLEYKNESQKDFADLLKASLGTSIEETAQHYSDKHPVAVLLTGEQARLLIADAHPNNPPAQARALFAITNTEEPVTVLNGSVSLDYSNDAPGYFAVLDKNAKPALDQKLIQLQTRENQKYQSSRQQQSSQRSSRDDDYERD